MDRAIAVVGAPSSIGIRPYDDGGPRRLDLAPGALREQGLVARLGASDLGDVVRPPYVDFARPGIRPRNEAGVAAYSRALARAPPAWRRFSSGCSDNPVGMFRMARRSDKAS